MNNQELIERYLKMIKLKDIIKRINELELSAKQYWIDEILKELGSDYGRLKYRSGYEQGKIEGMVERETVKVPQFVADWYRMNKDNLDKNIAYLCSDWGKSTIDDTLFNWMSNTDNFVQILVNMHQFGYEVEKEKRYLVNVKGVNEECEYLFFGELSNTWKFRSLGSFGELKKYHTRKELEEAGFGWVFNCEGIEIEEVD